MFPSETLDYAATLLDICRERRWHLATAESCTGGLICGALTAIAGSSDVVERGFVTYTNTAKTEMLGVSEPLFETVGAVSEEVARAMADGVLTHTTVDLALSVTGVAGPGASERKPAGLVYIGCAIRGRNTVVLENRFSGDRDSVRLQSVNTALKLALDRLASGD